LVVRLPQATQDVEVSPGEASILQFSIDTGDETENVEASMLQFEGSDSHIVVEQAIEPSSEPVPVMLRYTVDEDVCEELCAGVHEVTLVRAVRLEGGEVSERVEATITLDCRASGDPELCSAGDVINPPSLDSGSNEPDASPPMTVDASEPVSLVEAAAMLSSALRDAHDALCTSCSDPSRVPCYAIVPSGAIGCIEDALTGPGADAETLSTVQALVTQIHTLVEPCTTCDFDACAPSVLSDALAGLPDELGTTVEACIAR
jgi:hypothetical protein